jgi:hypothetical protein
MKNNYNEMVRSFNRSRRKLRRLISENKNAYKQDILKKRVMRLFWILTGMQSSLKLGVATAALTIGMVMIQPNAAQAQVTFAPVQINPDSLTGTGARQNAPDMADIDGDGDLDILSGNPTGSFLYYQNIGTATAPLFTDSVSNPFGLTNTGSSWSTVVFVDLDGDGDLDMMSGSYEASFFYYENTGTATAPAFAAAQQDPFGIMATPYETFPSFADLDGDGDMDLLSGQGVDGSYVYFENTGSANAPAFAAGSNSVFGLTFGAATYSSPTFADLDGDGDLDIFEGIINSTPNTDLFYYYQNTGTSVAPAFSAAVLNPFSLTGTIGNCPTFGDLDGDGDLDLMVGTYEVPGDFGYFENTYGDGIVDHTVPAEISVYPNPASDFVNVHFENTNQNVTIELTNTLGEVISTTVSNSTTAKINLPDAKGVYFIKVINAENQTGIRKVVKQ